MSHICGEPARRWHADAQGAQSHISVGGEQGAKGARFREAWRKMSNNALSSN